MLLVGALAQSCGKISEVDSGAFKAAKICTLVSYTGKILSAVKNSRNVSKISWNLFLAFQPSNFNLKNYLQLTKVDKQNKGNGPNMGTWRYIIYLFML